MIDQATALEHIRSWLEDDIDHPVYLVEIPADARDSMPYAILYPLPTSTRPAAPLANDPGPWRLEIQATAVGRNMVDASWMISRCDHAMRMLPPATGRVGVSVHCTVSAVLGESQGVTTMVQRWAVALS